MRRGGGGKRRDANEKPIREALISLGAHVETLSGEGAPDLLVRFRGRWWPLEVKSAQGRRTAAQQRTQYPIVRSVEDAFHAIGLEPKKGEAR